jgi:FkbM family methyltransferase
MIKQVVKWLRGPGAGSECPQSEHFSQPADVERAEYCFYTKYLRPGMTVFDVGANVGGLTLLFYKFVSPDGTVHSFECNHSAFSRLKTVVHAFCGGDEQRVHLNEIGMSDTEGQKCLYEYPYGTGSWSTLARRDLTLPSGERALPVERIVATSTVDAYCLRNKISRIDLLKIDVEGAELQVLRGASKMLAARMIKCITFEFGQTLFDMGNTPTELLNLLDAKGYSTSNLIACDPAFPGGGNRETAAFSMHVSRPL